jgi:hypothetical protein
MPTADASQWRIFNVLLRLLGFGATFAGAAAVTSFGLGIPAPPGEAHPVSVPAILTGGLVTVLGLGFLLLPPFRPDLGDTKVVGNPFRTLNQPRRRSWWTGDPSP